MLKDIFKTYDIRGVFGEGLDENSAYKIGRAFVEYVDGAKVVVGRDMRESSPVLFDALVKGIMDQGAHVIDIGLCSTPMYYFAVNYLKADGGVMVTASHNPAKYNGFKMVKEKAIPFTYDDGIMQVEVAVFENKFTNALRTGEIEKKDIIHEYANFILSKAKKIPAMKIVADTSNGMAGLTLPVVLEGLDIELIHINAELDGTFPNHSPNPVDLKAYKQLTARVKKEKAPMGVIFDGDADRIGFVDEKGQVIMPDIIEALLASRFVKSTIIYAIRSSWTVAEEIKKSGNKPVMWKVGHSFMKSKMKELKAEFGAEITGHFYFKFEDAYYENSILTMLMVADMINSAGKPFSEIVKPLQRYFKSPEINTKVDDKIGKISEIKAKYTDGKVTEIDGLRVDYDDWWFNVRESHTEDFLRLMVEAKSQKLLDSKTKELLKIIKG